MNQYNITSNLKFKGDITDQIYEPIIHRIVADVEEDLTNKLIENLNKAYKTGQEVFPVIIESYGGEVYTLMSLIDILSNCEMKVITIATGKAMSCGSILLSCGDERYLAPNTTVMLHEVSSASWGKNNEIQASAKETERLNELLFHMLDKNCRKKKGFFINLIKKNKHADLFLNADECLDYNIVDHIGIPKFVTTVDINFDVIRTA